MTARLLLVRHGRVDFASKDFRDTPRGPQWDPPLDDAGREQARKLAARLAEMERPAGVFVSPFRRCRQTLAPYEEIGGVEGEVVEDLREVFVGAWEGVSFEDLIAEHEALIRRRVDEHEPLFNLAPDAESGEELRARVRPVVERLLHSAGEMGTIVIVTHGGVINAYLGHVLGLPQDMFFLPDNASINVVDADSDRRRVRFLNDVAHLHFPALWEGNPGSTAAGILRRNAPER